MTLRLGIIAGVALADARGEGHNRWHPGVPPLATIAPGEVVTVDMRDGFDGQLTPASSSASIDKLDLYRGHPLTGPVAVEGAAPGDLLDVEIVEVSPGTYGVTAVMPGVGPLGARITEPFLVHWRFEDGVARSDELPGIAVRGAPFLGVMGVAPSLESIESAGARERRLADAGHVVALPDSRGAVPADEPVASQGLPTLPPREHGGNLDVRQLAAGSRVTFAVQVPGALLSVGDPHFAQGDGESGGTAIEMPASATLRVGLRKAGAVAWRPRYPTFEFHPLTHPGPHIGTTGIPAGDGGYLDVYSAAQEALSELVDMLIHERGLGESQAIALVGVASDLRISEIVNVPNPLVSAILPLDVFE